MKRRLLGKIAGYATYSTVIINKTYGDIDFINPITITGDGTITYSSNNTIVATINQNTGQVTILKPGEVIITATVTDSDYYSYETKNITYTLIVAKAVGNVSEPPVSATISYTGNSQQLVTSGSGTGTMMYKLNNGTWSTEIPTAINCDTYTIYYKSSENDYYTESVVGSLLVTITLSAPDYVAPTAKVLVYNGNEQELLNAGSTSDGTLYYSTDNNTWSESIPKGTNANSYTTYWKLEGDNNHTSISSTRIDVTIDKAENSLTATKHDDWTYDGESYALVSDVSGQGTITYSLNGGSDSLIIPQASDAGTYVVKIKATGDSNHYSKEISYTIVVNKVTPTVTITSRTVTYNRSALALITSGGSDFGILLFSLDETNWSTTIPTATNAGVYLVYYRVIGDSNINDIESTAVSPISEISPKSVTATITLQYDSHVYTGEALTPTVVAKDGSITIPSTEYTVNYTNNTNAGTATVTLIDKANGNYIVIGSTTFVITKADGRIDVLPVGKNLVYTGESQVIATAGSGTGVMYYALEQDPTYSSNIPSLVNAGTYTMYFYAAESTNYTQSTTKSILITIAKANPTYTAPTAKTELVYSGEALALLNTGSIASGNGTLQYSSDNSTWSGTIPSGTNAGQYTSYWRIVGNSNYNDKESTSIITTITKHAGVINIAPTKKNLTYNGNSQALVTAGSGSGTMLYKLGSDGTWSNNIPTGTIVGNYNIYYKVLESSNYFATDGSTYVTSSVSKVTPTVEAPTAKNLTYTGEALTLINAGTTNWGTLKYSLDNSTYSTSLPTGTNATTYTVYYKVDGDSNINDVAAKSIAVTIAKAAPSYTAPTANNRTYDTTSKALLNAGATNHGTIQYSSDNSTWSITIPSKTNAGTYTTYWRIIGDSNHSDKASASINTTISLKTVNNPTITLSPSSYTYNGNACLPTPTVLDGSITIASSEYTVSYSNNTNAGTGTCTITDKTGGNYTVSGSKTFTISKVTPTVSAPKANDLTYTGNAQTLTTAGSTNWGTLLYSTTETGTYSTTIPTGTAAGNYEVWYKVVGNSNINDVAAVKVTITIKKANPTYTAPTAKTGLVYNTSTQALLNEGSASGGTLLYSSNNSTWSTTIPTGTNASSYTSYWRIVGDSNHNDKASASISTTISPKTVNSPTITLNPSSYTYSGGQCLPTPTVKDGTVTISSGEYTVSYSDNVNAGTATCTITDKTNGNYTVSGSKTFTISKVTPTVTAPTAKVLTYNGSALSLANAGSTNFGTLKYSLDNSTWSTSVPTATNGGSYTLYYKVDGDSNINNVSVSSIKCSINEKEVTATVTLSSTSYTYNGNAKTPTVTVKDGSTVIPSSEYTVTYSNNTNAGTATVTITDKSGGNYNVIGSATFTINKAAGSVTTKPTAKSLTYNGNAQALVNAGSGTGTIYYSLSSSSGFNTSIPTGTAAGTYTVYFYAAASSNYNQSTPTESISVTIGGKPISIPTPTGYSAQYNGSAHTATFGSCTGASITKYRYSTNGTSWTESTTNPSLTNVGTLYTQAYYTAGTNYTGSGWSSSATISISRNTSASASAITGLVYNGTTESNGSAQTGVRGSQVSWSGTTSATNAGSYTAYATPTSNYAWSDGTYALKTISWSIARRGQTAPVLNGATAVFHNTATATVKTAGTVSGSTATAPGTLTWSNQSRTAVGSQTATAYYAATATNFSASPASTGVTVQITQASDASVSVTLKSGLTYSRGAQTLATATSHGCTYYLALGSNGTSAPSSGWTNSSLTATNAGTYYIWYKGTKDGNHSNDIGATYKGSVTINKATPVISTNPSNTSPTYNGSALNLLSGGAYKHSSSDSTAVTGTFTYLKGTNAGNYSNPTWTFTPTDTTNYNSTSGTRSGTTTTISALSLSSVTISLNWTSKNYNGSAQVPTATVKSGSTTLTSGTHYTLSYSNSSSKNAGSYSITANAKSNYSFTAVSANYTINKIDPTYSAPTAKTGLVYNGSSQTLYNASSSSNGTFSYSNGTRTAAGSQTVSWTFTPTNTTNYNTKSGSFSVSITARPINITASSNSKTYNKSALTSNSATAESTGTNRGLVSGHSMTSCTVTGTITNVGSTNNVPSSAIIKSGSTDVTSNYNINYVKGTLTVTTRTITLNWGTLTWTYDGSGHSTTCTAGNVCSGDTCTVTLSGNSITNKGTTTVTASSLSNSNYNLPSTKTTTLTINARSVTYKANNESWTYNGNTHSASNTATLTSGSLVSGHTATFSCTGSVGPNVGTATKTLSSVTIKNNKGTDVSSNYSITKNNGTLSIGKANQSAPTATVTTAIYPGTSTASASGGGGVGTLTWTNGNTRSAIGSQDTYAYWAGNSNYNASPYSNKITLSVSKYTPTVTLSATNRIYNGSALYASATVSKPTSGKAIAGTIYYGTSSGATTYSVAYKGSAVNLTSVSVTNYNSGSGNSVTVYAYFVPNSTCNDVYSNSRNVSKTMTITGKANLSAPTATGATTTYNTTATATATRGGGQGTLTWSNGNTQTSVGAKTTKAYWAGNGNYNASGYSNEVTVRMNPRIDSEPTNANRTYTGSALNLLTGGTASPSGGTWSYSLGTNAGSYTATWTYTLNRVSVSGSKAATILKADPSITPPTAKSGLVYNGSALTLYKAGSNTTSGSFSYSNGTRTAAGSQTVSWSFTPTNTTNYNSKSGSFSVSIAKRSRSLSWTSAPSSVLVYSSITVSASPSYGSGDGTITYSSGNTRIATVSGNIITGVSTGTVTIYANISKGTNHLSASTSYNLTVKNPAIELKYNVTAGTNCQLAQMIDNFSEMEIDGVTQSSVVSNYTFNTTGKHTVKYTMKDYTTISNNIFLNCVLLTNVTIPNSVTSIGDKAFGYCRALTSIDIPNSVTNIGTTAFMECSALTNVTIGNNVRIINPYAFSGCILLTSIVSNATTAPILQGLVFQGIGTGGTLTVPSGSSGYNMWMSLLSSWRKVER